MLLARFFFLGLGLALASFSACGSDGDDDDNDDNDNDDNDNDDGTSDADADGDADGDADSDADADADSDSDGDADCEGDCAGYYTPCTCDPSDPCGWSNDDYCDDVCLTEGIVTEMFDDSEDCPDSCFAPVGIAAWGGPCHSDADCPDDTTCLFLGGLSSTEAYCAPECCDFETTDTAYCTDQGSGLEHCMVGQLSGEEYLPPYHCLISCTTEDDCPDGTACTEVQTNVSICYGYGEIDTDTSVCSSGPCCDEYGAFAGTGTVCGTASAYACSGSVCGALAQQQVTETFCSGDSAQCTGAEVVGEWTTIETCAEDSICETDSGGAWCTLCDFGCSEGACADPIWDLAFVSLTAPAGTITSGGSASFDLQIVNNGSDPIAQFEVDLYLSTDTTITTGDALVCTVTIDTPLDGGASTTHTAGCTVPDVVTGDYYFGAILDPDNTLAETDETNNKGCDSDGTVHVIGPDYDLEPDICWGDSPVYAGSSADYSVTVRNWGSSAVGPFSIRLRYSLDTSYSSSDPSICTFTAAGLAASSIATFSTSCEVPSSIPYGDYFLAVMVDSTYDVPETDETNNTYVSFDFYSVN